MGLTPAPTESAHAMTHAVKLRPLVLDDLERVAGLAEKLCLQEWLDNLGPGELEAVWRDIALPAATG